MSGESEVTGGFPCTAHPPHLRDKSLWVSKVAGYRFWPAWLAVSGEVRVSCRGGVRRRWRRDWQGNTLTHATHASYKTHRTASFVL